ncbi:Pectinacetylesterase family protein [Perilla frutescens var. hirtella]|nr:Pectinacetylesterase family protein [Perilla frutescens var. frutescens]KAH6792095.1 Pectinacetylesterase family protein [Perilla frutescens var. hirtella]
MKSARVHAQTQIELTFLEIVVSKGADGSAPTYSYDNGTGSGSNNWIVYLQVNNLRFWGRHDFEDYDGGDAF